MALDDVSLWKCAAGHQSAHTETEILNIVIEPRCGLTVNGQVCMARLTRRLIVLPEGRR